MGLIIKTKEQAVSYAKANTPIDLIYDCYNAGMFFDISGKAGNDNVNYRIYPNGSITER